MDINIPRSYKGDAGVVNSDIENFRRSVWLVQVVLFFRIYQEKNFKIQLCTQYYPITKKDGIDYTNLCVDHSAMLFPDKMMQRFVFREWLLGVRGGEGAFNFFGSYEIAKIKALHDGLGL